MSDKCFSAEQIARAFHETYERLAPTFGYETRKASAVAWKDVPEPNKGLMIAVAGEVMLTLRRQLATKDAENARLRENLVSALEAIVQGRGHLESTGVHAGWWDTIGLSEVCSAGDRLVELGAWERYPGGFGRRWRYRPLEAAEQAKETT